MTIPHHMQFSLKISLTLGTRKRMALIDQLVVMTIPRTIGITILTASLALDRMLVKKSLCRKSVDTDKDGLPDL